MLPSERANPGKTLLQRRKNSLLSGYLRKRIFPFCSFPSAAFYPFAKKVIFLRLLKNAQMQGASFDALRINSPEE
jgi:hypothetical protein